MNPSHINYSILILDPQHDKLIQLQKSAFRFCYNYLSQNLPQFFPRIKFRHVKDTALEVSILLLNISCTVFQNVLIHYRPLSKTIF